MPVGDQYHGGVAMAVAVDPRSFDEAVDLGVGQVFARPRIGIAYAFGRPAVWLDCPNNGGWATSAKCDFAIDFRPFPVILSRK
jgi:hypothetical protein